MDKKVVCHPPLNLLALTLCEGATAQVEPVRKKLWQGGGNLLSLAFCPLIPLMWSSDPLPPFEQLELPLMPTRVTFDQVTVKEGVLYLKSEDSNYFEVVREIKGAYPGGNGLSYPFPPSSGILLGGGEWSDGPLEVVNDDWRLLYLKIGWHSLAGELLHLTHQVLTNRHLVKLNL